MVWYSYAEIMGSLHIYSEKAINHPNTMAEVSFLGVNRHIVDIGR